jgi:hypothetical protein
MVAVWKSVERETLMDPASNMRICTICGARVRREDCHRNRYHEYICHTCRATRRQPATTKRILGRLRRHKRKILYAAMVFLVGLSVSVFIVKCASDNAATVNVQR